MNKIIVSQRSSFSDILKKRGFNILVDSIAVATLMESFPFSPGSLQVAKYHFLDDLICKTHPASGVVYFTARAACLKSTKQGTYAYISNFNISNLISSYSSLIIAGLEINGTNIYDKKAGSVEESKRHYITNHLMNKTIEGISSLGPNGLTWKFIDPEHFLDFPATFSASSDFLEYMNNEYIELVNEITGVHHIGECEEWADDDIAFFKEQQEEEFFHHLISEGPGEKDEFLGEGEDEQYDENWDEDEFKH